MPRRTQKREHETLELIIYAIIIVVVVGGLLHIPEWVTNGIVQLLVSAFVGSVLSLIAGSLVEAFSGDRLKKIALNIEIYGFEFSITAFAIATVIVRIWLFGL